VASNAFLTFEQLDGLELQSDSLSLEHVPVVTAGRWTAHGWQPYGNGPEGTHPDGSKST
jgi:hypothetical protein